ncbi:unnamed protein product, partial [Mesorhabditis belari]|uniref:RNA exonuclease 4 n=1 Tax=Mesorhabditis belari TaxID=2138241 RepID=A0AAF3EZX8_9BILA
MAPQGTKKIDPAKVDTAWKVLQMKMREEKPNAAATSKTTAPPKVNARKRKFAMEKAEAEKRAKLAQEEDTIVISSNRDSGAPTPVMALDCEYVGTGVGGKEDALARVSIVNEQGKVVYDKYVKPKEKVTDFRTHVSGIRPAHLITAETFQKVRNEVCELFSGRTIVGHALHNDYRVLQLDHPKKLTRDTAKVKCLRNEAQCGKFPPLKLYAEKLLGIQIQQGEHDSVTDARVALRIYQMYKKKIEDEIARYK